MDRWLTRTIDNHDDIDEENDDDLDDDEEIDVDRSARDDDRRR